MAVPHRLLAAVGLFLACTCAPNVGRAYSAPEGFSDNAYEGGGGGRWFSGSPAEGYSCSVCHLPGNAPREFPLYVLGVPPAYSALTPQRITLTWPEFAQRWTELRPTPGVAPPVGQPDPVFGLITELVAESGKASGTIEISMNTADPAELCERSSPTLQPRLGVRMFQVRPGTATQPGSATAPTPPKLIRPDDQGIMRCQAGLLGQRCILAAIPCGSRQLSFTWTPPETIEGPIWFSAGFVATDGVTGTPEFDSVKEIAVPIVPAATGSAAYDETLLRSGCALAPWPQRTSSGGLAFAFVALAWIARRARRIEERY
jgi:hypothetical protein